MVIAVDFDGVLHHGIYPEIGPPSERAVSSVRELKNRGHYIIIWTSRSGEELLRAINWLLEHNCPFDRVNDHHPDNVRKYGNNTRKVYADVYIDDHNAGGLRSWSEIFDYITTIEQTK